LSSFIQESAYRQAGEVIGIKTEHPAPYSFTTKLAHKSCL